MIRAFTRAVSTIVPHILILFMTVLAIDVVSYYLLPDSIAFKFNEYRMERSVVGARAGYRPGYLVANQQRGHDIGPDRRGTHETPELIYPVWSNEFGCFDRAWDRVPDDYVYFAGDSFTWGYARYDDKFATLFEKETGKPSLKCGVTGTGTRHQFDKFREIIARVGHPPKRVIVSFFTNDVGDDYIYPSTTIVDGWFVNNVYIDGYGKPVHLDDEWLRERVVESLRQPPLRLSCDASLWTHVKCVSATANVLNAMRRTVMASLTQAPAAAPSDDRIDYRGRKIAPIHSLETELFKGDRLHYLDSAFAKPSREVIAAWAEHAKANGYKLSFMLIPPPHLFNNTALFAELRTYLDRLGIENLDLAEVFAASGLGAQQIYWRYDGHFSPIGNRIAADALIRRWGK